MVACGYFVLCQIIGLLHFGRYELMNILFIILVKKWALNQLLEGVDVYAVFKITTSSLIDILCSAKFYTGAKTRRKSRRNGTKYVR